MEQEPVDLPPAGRRIIAVGGSKGGVGKSLVAVNLAVYLAQLGRRVVLVDADATGANLHLSLGLPPLTSLLARGPNDASARDDAAIETSLYETSVPGLRLLPAPAESSNLGGLKAARGGRLIRMLKSSRIADDVVIDVGPGVSAVACDLFLAADVGVLVTTPEPEAIETTWRFVCASFVRDVRNSLRPDMARVRVFDRALTDLRALRPATASTPPRPIELVQHLLKTEPPIGEQALLVLLRVRPRLIVNQTRVRTDLELPIWMSQVGHDRLAVTLDPLGHIEHDDAVWLAHRRRTPLLVDNPSSKAGRCLERVARRLLAVFPHRQRERERTGALPKSPTHYDRLRVTRGASEEEVRRAYKRQREIFADDSLAIVSLFDDVELQREQVLLQEAHDVLLDPIRRRSYDVSVFPDHASTAQQPQTATDRAESDAIAVERLQQEATLAREIGPDTEFTGMLLRRVREARGFELRELSQKTKVSAPQLQAIEDEDFDKLPALVYVRGFLLEIARQLKLDGSLVARTYLRRARDLIELRRA
jgi:flagellar biosynthesis protein FlhG